MSLTSQLSRQFDSRVRARGVSYYRRGAVKIRGGDEFLVEALVKGTRQYEVYLDREEDTVNVYCSCPYFESNLEACKHIWATLLDAEGQGFLLDSETGEPPSTIAIDADATAQDDPDDDFGSFEYEWDEDDYDEDDGADDYAGLPHVYETARRALREARRAAFPEGNWKIQLAGLRASIADVRAAPNEWRVGREILYIVDVPNTMSSAGGLWVETAVRQRKMDGEWGLPQPRGIAVQQIAVLPDPADRKILAILHGATNPVDIAYSWGHYAQTGARQQLSGALAETVLPLMCHAGRCCIRTSPDQGELGTVRWDEGAPWEFLLKVTADESAGEYRIEGALCRGERELPLAQPHLLLAGALVFCDDWAARLDDHDAFQWILLLRERGLVQVPFEQRDELIEELLSISRLPKLNLPEELRYEEVSVTPVPRLKVQTENEHWGRQTVVGELSFDYDGRGVEQDRPGRGIYDAETRRFIVRAPEAEAAAAERLHALGFRLKRHLRESRLELSARHLPRVVRTLIVEDWHVGAEGKRYRRSSAFQISVASGIDWFDLQGDCQFGDQSASLPDLLKALAKGEGTVALGDGSFGILPEEWLKKYGLLAGLGEPQEGRLRFSRSQVGLLDALLASQPEASFDDVFARMRDELRTFEGIEPCEPPDAFVGELRGYQKGGLGWIHFLQRFGFGGCLADDMGLGKTIQVLALLELRRALREERTPSDDGGPCPGPSLVVVPKSLVFNWQEEAARFTPKLRVLDHTGTDRTKDGSTFDAYDVVITTYGTLRRDAPALKDRRFDYCILDEAQAIKNANTASAKAARLIQADHRLALSGTPIENHLGELWSLFEFLNPSMLGTAKVFGLLGGDARNPEPETRALLSQALRPFILRRTKDQVAQDLPPKVEQTLHCELEPRQRKLYDELREHYRQSLLAKVESNGLGRAKIQILEALLRLRQAAIHPGLIDQERTGENSAKLDLLLPQLAEVFEEGHKALVFSQFTKMLAIVRDRLDRDGIPYEYLDGRTRKRNERVARFQNDPECKLFLISLKAGGLGLNLTAAEYVFLLDPWWNPAVEAQAIDRTHRIGQERRVFAYRLIARDTVEEKVIELQQTKRDLADAIITADNSLIRNLRPEDLKLLLS